MGKSFTCQKCGLEYDPKNVCSCPKCHTPNWKNNPNNRNVDVSINLNGNKATSMNHKNNDGKYVFSLDFGTSTLQWSRIEIRPTATEPLPPAKTVLPNALRVVNGQLQALGEEAAAAAPAYPESTYFEYKMFLNGDDKHQWTKPISPQDLSNLTFKWLAENNSGLPSIQFTKESPLIVGVPGHWSADGMGRKAVLKAAQEAGIKSVHIVPEPYAAMLWWMSDNPKRLSENSKDDLTMVYDFGGGTLDVALFSGPYGTDELKYGAHVIGGKDFDAKLLDYVLDRIAVAANTTKNVIGEGDRNALLAKVRYVKERLSQDETAFAEVNKLEVFPDGWEIELERSQFEAICDDLLNKAVSAAVDVMKKNNVLPEKVRQVILTGGASNIFCLPTRLKAVLPHLDEHCFIRTRTPQHDVAKGLAVFGLEYYLENAEKQEKPIKVSDKKIQEEVWKYAIGAAAAAFFNPIPIVDLMAGVGINFKMAIDLAALFGLSLNENDAEKLGMDILKCLAGMGVVYIISSFLKIVFIGAFLQAAVAGYITLITGLAVAEYFKKGKSWGPEGMEAIVNRIKEQHPPIETLKIIAQRVKEKTK